MCIKTDIGSSGVDPRIAYIRHQVRAMLYNFIPMTPEGFTNIARKLGLQKPACINCGNCKR